MVPWLFIWFGSPRRPARFSKDKTNLALAPWEWIPVATEKNQRGFTTTNDRLRCLQTERTWGWLGSSD